ncbi:MAG: MFS transporter, partial [Deltaproteobacteria bacterium]|nr:MFS transporter [Deltaproteobacteria bacterium]
MTEAGVFQNILSIFMKPMVHDFGWSRASVTGAIAFGSISGGLLSLVFGPLLDRHGPRMVAFCGISILSMGLIAMAFINHAWQLYLFFGTGRMIAVGILSLAISISISNWFVRFRGRAMGITRIGDRLGSALLPLMVQFLILSLGWRMAWGILGGVVFFMSGIPSLLFLRRRPEDMGLLPDGAVSAAEITILDNPASKDDRACAADVDSEPLWTQAQAIRTKSFWMLTSLNSLIPFLQAGINFHIYPYLTDQGYSEMTAVLILSTISVSGMAGSAIWGMLVERYRIQGLLTINVIGNGLIFLALYWAVQFKYDNVLGIGIIFFLAALHGIFHGGRNPMITIAWADFFGRRSLGSILGLSHPFHSTANALGPVFAALCFDLLGNYTFPFYLFVFIFFFSGIITT